MSRDIVLLKEMGQRIAKRRQEMGLTQEELAEKGNMTPQFVSYAELGKRAMRPENVIKMADALEVSIDYLLTGETTDKDTSLISNKLRQLSQTQIKIIESIIDECLKLYDNQKG